MGPTQIALLILGGVGLMAIAAVFIQAAENRKKAKQLQLMKLQGAIRRAHHLLSNFPPLLQNPDINKFLMQYLTVRCQAVLQLEESEATEKLLNDIKQQAEQAQTPAAHPEGSITLFPNPNGAQRARAILKEFVKFVKEAETNGEISGNASQILIQRAKDCFERTEIDLELHEARETEEINAGKGAFLIYKKTFIRLSELSKNYTLDRQLFELRNRMNMLAEQIEKHNEEERERIRREAEENEKRFLF